MDQSALKSATARIIGGNGATVGTGFLAAADGFILTCWHVIEEQEPIRVQLEDETGSSPAEIRFDFSSRETDVAVLHVPALRSRPLVRVGFEWNVGDEIWSYGYQYQQYFSSGYPIVGRISGDTHMNGQQLIVVSSTDVQRGLSGSPVLNVRTGRVVAMINAKLDDRGIGFAIPLTTVGRVWGELHKRVTSPGERLVANTANLFRAMGHQVTPGHESPISGLPCFRAELTVGPTRIAVVVGCLESERALSRDDLRDSVFAFQTLLSDRDHDKAYLVTSADFTAEAKTFAASHGMALLSYRELEGSLIDFRDYANAVVYDFENFQDYTNLSRYPIIEAFRWSDLHRYFVDLRCVDPLTGEHHDSAIGILRKFVEHDDSRHISFLGDYGTGKTSLCLRLTYELAKAYREDPATARIPIFVPLHGLDLRAGISRLLLDTLAEYGIPAVDYSAFDIMLRAGRFVLIFDGFDEVADRLDRRNVMRVFGQISALATQRSKVVLTCRTHYFKSESQSVETLTTETMTPLMREVHQRRNFRLMELERFTDDQIVELMSRHTRNYQQQWRDMQSIYNLADLARTPILLNIMVNSLGRLLTLRPRDTLDSASLYDVYTKFWLERDDRRSSVTSAERVRFAHELAWHMYTTDRLSIPYEELSHAVSGFFSDVYRRNGEWLAQLDTNIRTCSFLARDKLGNYMFAHKSFMEFFVACKLAERVNEWAGADLWSRIISYEVVAFLQQLLSADDVALVKRYALDRGNGDVLRSLCMDLQIGLADTVQDEPLIFALASSPDGALIACANADRTARMFTADLTPVGALSGHGDWVRCVAFSGDGQLLATCGWDRRVVLWSLTDLQPRGMLQLSERVNSICFSPDSRQILCAGYDRLITVWTVPGLTLAATLSGHSDGINGIGLDRAGEVLVSGGLDKTVRVWALSQPDNAPQITQQEEPVTAVAVTPDGTRCAAGTWTGELAVWETAGLRLLWRSRAHGNMIGGLQFSPDGDQLVSCSDDKTAKVWSSEAGAAVTTMDGVDFVMAACFSPDGDTVYLGGYDTEIRAWDTRTWSVLRSLRLSDDPGHGDDSGLRDDPAG